MHERQIKARTTIKQEGGGRWWLLNQQKSEPGFHARQ